MTNRILMAQVGSAHGIKGEVRIKSFGADPLALADYDALTTENGIFHEITSLRSAKGQMLVARLKGISDRSAAEALNGTKLYIERDQLAEPDEDEFYQTDLIGCAAVDESGESIGTVLAVVNFGAGDLLDVKLADNSTIFIPFDKNFVPKVDIRNRIVVLSSLDTLLSNDDDDDEPS